MRTTRQTHQVILLSLLKNANVKAIATMVFTIGLCFAALAQTNPQGTVIFNVFPSTAIVRCDTQLIADLRKPVAIDTGKHLVRIWAPKMQYYEREITVKPNQTTVVGKALTYSEPYRAHRKELSKWKFSQFLHKKAPPIVVSGIVVFGTIRYFSNRKQIPVLYEDALAAKQEYESTFVLGTISFAKTQWEVSSKKYQRRVREQNLMRFGGPVFLVGSYYAWRKLKQRAARINKPVYSETPLLSSVQFDIGLYDLQTPMATIQLKL